MRNSVFIFILLLFVCSAVGCSEPLPEEQKRIPDYEISFDYGEFCDVKIRFEVTNDQKSAIIGSTVACSFYDSVGNCSTREETFRFYVPPNETIYVTVVFSGLTEKPNLSKIDEINLLYESEPFRLMQFFKDYGWIIATIFSLLMILAAVFLIFHNIKRKKSTPHNDDEYL